MLSSSAKLIVNLEDENDNLPVFTSPAKGGSLKLELSEDTPPGTVVHTFAAVDADKGENGMVTFHLKGGAGGQHFYLNPTTGRDSFFSCTYLV